MLTVRIKTVEGNVEAFETQSFVCVKAEKMKPEILCVEVFSESGKRMCKVKRHFQRFYKKYIFKPSPVQPQMPIQPPLSEGEACEPPKEK